MSYVIIQWQAVFYFLQYYARLDLMLSWFNLRTMCTDRIHYVCTLFDIGRGCKNKAYNIMYIYIPIYVCVYHQNSTGIAWTCVDIFDYFFCSYNILILLVTYVLPIILIGICSFHMGVVLWMRQPVGVITPQLQRARRKKQKVSRISLNVLERIKESKLNLDKCDA